jgi:hypothetical protein
MAKPIEIEIDGPCNEALHFRPLMRSIRGRFDFMRIPEPQARIAGTSWPVPIPSQRLGIDPNGDGYLLEPLHDEEHSPIREKIEKAGGRLEPPVQEFKGIDLPSWLFWLKRAVEAGIARVVSGKLPESIEGKPRMNYIVSRPERSTADRLASAIERQNDLFEALLKKLGEK